VPPGEIERWANENDPIDRYSKRLVAEGFDKSALDAIDTRVKMRSIARLTKPTPHRCRTRPMRWWGFMQIRRR